MQNKHRENFDWNFEKSGLLKEQKELDVKKALYGRNNSLKMGRMPATPDEGYYKPFAPAVERQWFRNEEQKRIYAIRQNNLEQRYIKRKKRERI